MPGLCPASAAGRRPRPRPRPAPLGPRRHPARRTVANAFHPPARPVPWPSSPSVSAMRVLLPDKLCGVGVYSASWSTTPAHWHGAQPCLHPPFAPLGPAACALCPTSRCSLAAGVIFSQRLNRRRDVLSARSCLGPPAARALTPRATLGHGARPGLSSTRPFVRRASGDATPFKSHRPPPWSTAVAKLPSPSASLPSTPPPWPSRGRLRRSGSAPASPRSSRAA